MAHKIKCKYFGKCGGCSLQNLPYKKQLELKLTKISERVGFPKEKIEVFPSREFFYRNRMDFVISPQGIGLKEKGKWWKVIDIERCEIANERVNTLLGELREFFLENYADPFDVEKKEGTTKYAVVRTTSFESSITFILNKDSTKKEQIKKFLLEFSKQTKADNVLIGWVSRESSVSISEDLETVKGKEFLVETINKKKFDFHSQGFFQNNIEIAEKMTSYIQGILEKNLETRPAEILFDLYGGVGVFGVSYSNLFKKIFVVESFPKSIDCANHNILHNSVKNVELIKKDVENMPIQEKFTPKFVIVDPPRKGITKKAMRRILALEPSLLIYVSCNPSRFAEEKRYFERKGYYIRSLALFDMFPQTEHTEIVVEMLPVKKD